MNSIKRITLGLGLSLCMSQALAIDDFNTPWYNNIAIQGYDPVAYFTQNTAVKGKESHQLEWNDVDWQFSSAENKVLFAASPEKYAPQYGGYCAWAAAQNNVAGIEPDQFTIVDGKLYLNYNENIKNKWLLNTAKHIADGDRNWPGLLTN